MFLPILVAWFLLTVPTGSSSGGRHCHVCPACCNEGSNKVDGEILQCFEQRAGKPCLKHFFLVIVKGHSPLCINSGSPWLKQKMEIENLKCPPADSLNERQI